MCCPVLQVSVQTVVYYKQLNTETEITCGRGKKCISHFQYKFLVYSTVTQLIFIIKNPVSITLNEALHVSFQPIKSGDGDHLFKIGYDPFLQNNSLSTFHIIRNCTTLSLGHILTVVENRVLRKIFGYRKHDV